MTQNSTDLSAIITPATINLKKPGVFITGPEHKAKKKQTTNKMIYEDEVREGQSCPLQTVTDSVARSSCKRMCRI